MQTPKRKLSRRAALAALAVTPPALYLAYRANELAAEPVGEKECDPLTDLTPLDPPTVLPASELPWSQTGGAINDASCLDETPVYGIVRVKTEADIRNTLQFARANGLKVALAGVRHSMGGQAFARGAVVLDMLQFNAMSLDEAKRTITVQSGATWHAIQNFLHPKYAVKAMQSTDIFSIGGSISVNAHGMDHQAGAIGRTIRALRLMSTDGAIEEVSRTQNPELFRLVIGGYGLFGVILDAELDITDNAVYATGRRIVDYAEFPDLFANELLPDPRLGLFYGHLSTAPQSLLREMIFYTYMQQEVTEAEIPPLGEVSSVGLRRFVINFSKLGDIPMRIKWFLEKYVEPRMEACTVVSRNQAQAEGEACLVSRNEPMHDSVTYLRNTLKGETDILHEYFIPRGQFITFVDGLRRIITDHKANPLNASVRVVHAEDNFLSYAPADAFSIVLYINQTTDKAGHAKMHKLTGELIDLTAEVGGRFFLPYQLHYTSEQLERAYPEIRAFFAAKRQYDPDLLLTNTWYEKYAGSFA
ncbi:MAG: FAD-binding protein [Anaerolineales bacterium]